jgi:hypothetical protein
VRDRPRIPQPARGGYDRTAAKAPAGQVASVQALGRAIGNRALARLLQPQRAIARDLKGDHAVDEGTFTLDLETVHPAGGKNGMRGSIKFLPKDSAPDSTNIRLYQAVRDEDLGTGTDYVWSGGEAPRNQMQTVADASTGMQAGWFIDHSASSATKRTRLADPAVSSYYRDYWPNPTGSQDGSKAGTTKADASLWDFPGSSGNRRFSFETVAKATDTGHSYGSVFWGFTIKDASKGEVTDELAYGRNVTLATTDEALRRFNEYYRNPGASTAPTT